MTVWPEIELVVLSVQLVFSIRGLSVGITPNSVMLNFGDISPF